MSGKKQKVVVVGASPKPERYSNKAVRMLLEYGHEVVPVAPAASMIEGLGVVATLKEVEEPVDTVTLYVGPAISSSLESALISLHPKRVIFNPGTENPELQAKLVEAGIKTEAACTLVMLRTDQFQEGF